MNVPKYVKELMARASFVLGEGDPGYTIKIAKATPYTKALTLKKEIIRLKSWVERQMPKDCFSQECPTMVINQIPEKTHYRNQYAIVTIYDPIMKKLEKYIPNNRKEKHERI